MSTNIWLLYVATVLALMSTPGPSHLLMVSNSMSNGFRRSLATALGDLTANVFQMLAAGLGLVAVLVASKQAFSVIKWLGVSYLIWLGIRMIWRSFSSSVGKPDQPPASLMQLWLQGFVTSAANPKAVVFFAALFPQFIDHEAGLGGQIAILGATYIAIDGAFLVAYGAGAEWLANRLRDRVRVWLDRFAGVCLFGTAVLLGLKSVQKS
ncbi:MAG: LysE family translocator [Myxococcales bacterium]|nr:LysE family translocator [Myxococcales bacterium]